MRRSFLYSFGRFLSRINNSFPAVSAPCKTFALPYPPLLASTPLVIGVITLSLSYLLLSVLLRVLSFKDNKQFDFRIIRSLSLIIRSLLINCIDDNDELCLRVEYFYLQCISESKVVNFVPSARTYNRVQKLLRQAVYWPSPSCNNGSCPPSPMCNVDKTILRSRLIK
jgi:hypothetical protein